MDSGPNVTDALSARTTEQGPPPRALFVSDPVQPVVEADADPRRVGDIRLAAVIQPAREDQHAAGARAVAHLPHRPWLELRHGAGDRVRARPGILEEDVA